MRESPAMDEPTPFRGNWSIAAAAVARSTRRLVSQGFRDAYQMVDNVTSRRFTGGLSAHHAAWATAAPTWPIRPTHTSSSLPRMNAASGAAKTWPPMDATNGYG